MLIRTLLVLSVLFLGMRSVPCAGQERSPDVDVWAVNGAPRAASENTQVTTADFVRIKRQIDRFVEKHGSDQVLLVVDIDNTLLAMNQDLGSDQWFNWQNGLLDSDSKSRELVAQTFEELLHVQGTLFAVSGMHPPDPKLPSIVAQIQATGVTTVVLTSRGPEFRDAAERELSRNGYDFTKSALEINEQRGRFKPYDALRPRAHCLSVEIIAALGSSPRDVTYSSGIYMTAGQHKGYMLKTLLARAIPEREIAGVGRLFKAIVFVDDHPKHIVRVQEAFQADGIDIATFQYSQEDGNVSNFNSSSKQRAVHDWNRLRESIDRVLIR